MNGIDPKYVFWLGVVVSIELGIGQGVVPLSDMFPADWVHWIKGWSAGLAFAGTTIMTALSGYSSKVSGPLVKPVVLVAVLLAGLFAFPGDASAQGIKLRPPTGDLVKDIQAATSPAPKLITGNVEKDAHAIWDKLVSASQADLKYASALAASANTPASSVRKQCYDAIITLNTQVNGMNVKDANGVAVPQPDPKLFTGVEQAAETIDNLSPSGPLFTNCAGMAQLMKTNVLTLVNAIVTGAAGFAAMPIIPGL